jgi:uncharacterized protein (UPF0147 family)
LFFGVAGMAALLLSFGLVFIGCPTDPDPDPDPAPSGKPTALATNATAAQALATLDAIIAYPGTPAATKTSAQTLKAQWNTYASNWSYAGASAISAINTLIASIPSGTDPDPDPNPDPDPDPDPDPSGKPTALATGATAAQALATLDAIIDYSGTPAATKTSAQTLKAQWSTYASNWSYAGASAISAINTLIASIP